TSKTCSNCGTLLNIPLSKRKFKCLNCGFVCHRDLNASININTAGLAEINACGLDVRPSLVKAVEHEAGTKFEPA
ncbi:MAG: transposase, partial [Nanoarchaeota archaeon]|nr:transposase [Nanoarchaeota archaeon]